MKNFSLQEQCEKYKDNIFLIHNKHSRTYSQFLNTVQNVVFLLQKHNIRKGERLGLVSHQNADFITYLIGIIHYGAVAVIINPKNPDKMVKDFLMNIDCRKLIKEKDKNIFKVEEFKFVDLDYSGQFIKEPKHIVLPYIKEQQESSILLTSGSQGNSKAVLHTFGNHYYSAMGSGKNISFKSGDKWLIVLPFYHVGALSIIFRALVSGGTIVLTDPALQLGENILKYKITHLSVVPTQLKRLLNESNSRNYAKLKVLLAGGGPVSPELLRKSVKNKIPLYYSYGSTEMASQITTTQRITQYCEKVHAGKVLPYRQLKIAADNEILVKGKTLFKGYIGQKNIKKSITKDGWFKTGDTGYLDSENNLHVTGRKDNMYISGGENIFPEEIEQVLLNEKDISEAVVVSVPHTDFGEIGVAFITPAQNSDKIINNLKKNLPAYKIPKYFFALPEIKHGIKHSRKDLETEAKYLIQKMNSEDRN